MGEGRGGGGVKVGVCVCLSLSLSVVYIHMFINTYVCSIYIYTHTYGFLFVLCLSCPCILSDCPVLQSPLRTCKCLQLNWSQSLTKAKRVSDVQVCLPHTAKAALSKFFRGSAVLIDLDNDAATMRDHGIDRHLDLKGTIKQQPTYPRARHSQ